MFTVLRAGGKLEAEEEAAVDMVEESEELQVTPAQRERFSQCIPSKLHTVPCHVRFASCPRWRYTLHSLLLRAACPCNLNRSIDCSY